jgi:VCBS repeat-containing protein
MPAPIANNDGVYGVAKGRSLTVSSYTGVLANDFDADHDTLSTIKLTDPSHGTVTLNADGSFTYTPTAGYTGTDSFTYKVNDGSADSATATVTFNVAAGSPFPNIDLTVLTPAQGFIIQGDADGDRTGWSVASAGDVNGDGYADLIVGASYGDDGGGEAGEAYVVFGKASGFGTSVGGRQVIDLTALAAADGFIIQGDAAGDFAGWSVASAGDVNGDGYADLILGAPDGDDGGSDAGEAYVVFGKAAGFGTSVGGRQVIDLTSLPAADGFIIQGDAASDDAGDSVASAGDVNGDGYADLIVGARNGDDGGSDAGEAYVVFGKASGFGSADGSGRQVIDLADLAATAGFIVQGDAAGDQAGQSVASAGDVNGDGYADLIVGNSAGAACVVFGKASGFGAPVGGRQVIDLTALAATDGFIVQGDGALGTAGWRVASAGDVNGDGYADLIVGAPTGTDAGEAYVVFGKASGFGSADSSGRQVIDLTSLSAADGFIIQGDAADRAGHSVASAGDVNGDGHADLIVSAPDGDDGAENAGEAYVVFGKASGFGTADGSGRQVIDLTALSPRDGFKIQGDTAFDRAGHSVAAAGDVNGDGFADLIVGALFGDDGGSNAGEAYVLFGHALNTAPLAHDDGVYGVAKGRSLTVSSYTGVLANDFDAEHDTLTAIKLTDPAHGTVTLNADGAFTYTPTAGYTGTDSFTYKVNDGSADSATATVTFNVAAGSPFPTIDLAALTGAQGFIIQGDEAFDLAGNSVASAGDVNGDGYADLIVGAPNGAATGAAYVVFGKASGFGTDVSGRQVIDLTSLAAAEGFIIQGDPAGDNAGTFDDNTGTSVASAGDVNGDGYADLIIGAPAFGGGSANVVFGKASGFGTSVGGRQVIDLASLPAADGFIFRGGLLGRSVASAGDVNGDGYADLIVEATFAAGESCVVFGKAQGFGTADSSGRQVLDRTELAAADGFIIRGDTAGEDTSYSVAAAGDVNGDGYADLIVGSPGDDDGGLWAGEAYVVFGKASGFGIPVGGRQVIDLAALSAADGFIIQGYTAGDFTGYSVATAGDVNGDGYADLIVGAPGGDDGGSGAGEAYVVFGRASGFGTPVGGRQVIDLTALSAADGFIVQGAIAGDNAGFSVASAGDVNGDGYADLIVAAPLGGDGGSLAGEVYVVFGKASGFGAPVGGRQVIDLAALSPRDGFKIQGDAIGDQAGWSVASAGDVNRDGFADLIVAAPFGDDGGNVAGETYVLFGHAFNTAPSDLALAPASVTENSSSGTVVGAFTTTDADDSNGFTYTLVNDAGGRFAISGSNLVVASGALIDFEQHTSHAVTVQVTDPGGATFEETFVVTVTNVPGLPSDDSFNAPAGLSQFEGGGGTDTISFGFKLTEATVTYSGTAVIIDGPGGSHTALAGFERFAFTDGTVNNNDGSPLIDDLFYFAQNHDVWNAHVDADWHYNVAGWKEGRDPSAFFDTSIYLSANPDVAAGGGNPLHHFDTVGWKEARVPALTFDPQQYLAANPDVAAAKIDPLWHFLAIGASEGRQPFDATKLIGADGFDFVHYLTNNPDVAAAGVDPLWHFQNIGWKEGRDPNALFDTSGYLATYGDVDAANINPLDHYNASGWNEGRDPSVNFDTKSYLAAYPDVAAAHVNPLMHFLYIGKDEGRSAFADGTWG